MSEFDGWKHSSVGKWFFEYVLPQYVAMAAQENGTAVGTYGTKEEDYMIFVRNAGHISGVEYVINLDPFEEERDNEAESTG